MSYNYIPKIENPKVKTIDDVLLFFYENSDEYYTIRFIQNYFGMNRNDAKGRINKLRKWECLVKLENAYKISTGGKKYMANKIEKSKVKEKVGIIDN